ncbi:MAG: hypothetical protein MN733_15455, partial [Nitrososphaera sp.]|nr:hypothetical protein [Nitrososphaera sp.]
SAWTTHRTLTAAKKRAQQIANKLGREVNVYWRDAWSGDPTDIMATVYPKQRGQNMGRRRGRNPIGPGRVGPARVGAAPQRGTGVGWTPVQAVRLLPGGRIQVKARRGSLLRNPEGAMFRDESGVIHPIRGWEGYSASAAGEGRRKARKKTKKRARPKRKTASKKRVRRKRTRRGRR